MDSYYFTAACARALEENLPRSRVCVVAGREKLEQANRQLAGQELAISEILKKGS